MARVRAAAETVAKAAAETAAKTASETARAKVDLRQAMGEYGFVLIIIFGFIVKGI